MTRFQFWVLALWALGLTTLVIPKVWSEDPPTTNIPPYVGMNTLPNGACVAPAEKSDLTCTVYALSDLGDDPDLGRWVAETIPEVIQPGTWAGKSSGQCRLRYHAATRVLVVCHRPAVQAEVDAFLKNVKKALPARGGMTRVMSVTKETAVVPAQFLTPRSMPAPAPMTREMPGSGYPVPAAAKQPKHLFHFIIRYEGEGVVDNNVADMVKGMTTAGATPTVCAPPAVIGYSAPSVPPSAVPPAPPVSAVYSSGAPPQTFQSFAPPVSPAVTESVAPAASPSKPPAKKKKRG
jgi:hypothetical protein